MLGAGDELLELLIGHLSKDAARRGARGTPSAGEGPATALTLESARLHMHELFTGESGASESGT